MAEYKLSYTASEIDEKLGKVNEIDAKQDKTHEIVLEAPIVENIIIEDDATYTLPTAIELVAGDIWYCDTRGSLDGVEYRDYVLGRAMADSQGIITVKFLQGGITLSNTTVANSCGYQNTTTIAKVAEYNKLANYLIDHSEGYLNVASGKYSHVEGYNVTASGGVSHAEGYNTVASGNYTHAEGSNTVASGSYTHTEGRQTTASGTCSHAEGYQTTASKDAGHAEGYQTTASNTAAHAEGYQTTASGRYSHAEGYKTTASGKHSHVEGDMTFASGEGAHAEGKSTFASGKGAHAEGSGERTGAIITGDANTTVYTLDKKIYAKIGDPIVFNNICAIIIAYDESALTLTVDKSLNPDVAVSSATATAYRKGIASGESSHVEGECTIASGRGAHAEGGYTTASGEDAHAEGSNTIASSESAHAEGEYTTASGNGAHAEGSNTIASGFYSHAEGSNTIALGEASHVQGRYNIKDKDSKYAHIVGNGEDALRRSNAHTLDWEGNAWYAGDVYVGSNSGTNKDEGSKILATQEYVNIRVPAWTEADEGKVLKIVNGVPTWAAISDTEATTTITFTIDDIEYQADNGMTWYEWCQSEYNTDGFVTELEDYVWDENLMANVKSDATGIVTGSDEIVANEAYYLIMAEPDVI